MRVMGMSKRYVFFAFTQARVGGRVGLWSKTDSTSRFKDLVVSPR